MDLKTLSDEELLKLWSESAKVFHHIVRYGMPTKEDRNKHFPIRDEAYRRGFKNKDRPD